MDIISSSYSVLAASIDMIVLVLGITCALVSGVFFAFSSFVMTAFGRLAPANGIRAMQQINIDVFSWSFMSLFLGLPVVFLLILVLALLHLGEPYTIRLLLAALLYLSGVFVVTMFCNVPLNNALARLDVRLACESDVGDVWRRYVVVWGRWNHVRTVASVAAAIVLLY